mmetsp:Transcript_43563/g.128253  ORF Transcript_43563/g.128253 Transcript_43563/m.128253 type:complete len:188 (-) Transcript_43563:174-737(-)
MTTEYSAVARAVLLLTIFQSCIPLAGLRQRRRLVLPLTVHHLRACRRPLDSSVARDARYRGIIFASDGVDGRSAERERKSPQPRSFQQRHKSSDPSHTRLRLVTHSTDEDVRTEQAHSDTTQATLTESWLETHSKVRPDTTLGHRMSTWRGNPIDGVPPTPFPLHPLESSTSSKIGTAGFTQSQSED